MITAQEALARLIEGNRRYVADTTLHDADARRAQRRQLLAGQNPFAVILGCSDSRVPVEMVFDQGLGDLFVIRVAGNIVAPSQIGSVEFAAERFGCRLVLVLGHSHCGAVAATLEELQRPAGRHSPHLSAIVDRVRPAVEGLALAGHGHSPDEIMHQAVRANIRTSAQNLRHGSTIIERLIAKEGLQVVGAEYALDTGVVDFFDYPIAKG